MASGTLIHWLITRTYFKVANDTGEELKQANEGKQERLKDFAGRLRNMDIIAGVIITVFAGEYFAAIGKQDAQG
jgi:hypothetical protein